MNSSPFIIRPSIVSFLFLLGTCFLQQQHVVVTAIKIGDKVCMRGYIMDIYCIERGSLLDNPSINTLEEPDKHSFHCLFDEAICYNSGFVVLGEKDADTSLHCLGLRLDETDVVMSVGRAAGSSRESSGGTHITCRTCTGDASKPVAGYRATVRGTVKELGDDSSKSTVYGQPLLNNIELLDFEVGCNDAGDDIGITVESIDGECQIVSSIETVAPSDAPSLTQLSSYPPSVNTAPTATPSDGPSMSSSPTISPSTSSNPSKSIVPSKSTIPSLNPSESFEPSLSIQPSIQDCTKQFCEETLADEYLLRYRINVEDRTITMEVEYDGEAWVAVAFSEDDKMPGSDAVIGSPDNGSVQKYRLLAKSPVVDSAIELMPDEKQTLIDASIVVTDDGKTIMKFTKYLEEPGQIEIKMEVNNMLWAYGVSKTLSYHDKRSPFTLDLSSTRGGSEEEESTTPTFEASTAPSQSSTLVECTPWPDAAWLQPNFCSNVYVDGLSRPRGLHIEQGTDEMLLVERGASRVVRLVSNGENRGTIEPLLETENLGLNHGIELSGGYLYASSSTNVYRWPYVDGTVGETEDVIVGMASGGHFTRTLAFDAEGKWLYVSIGSLNNADPDSSRSRIRRFDISAWDGVTPFNFDDDGELFADGLRNEVGMAFDVNGDLWGVENGADNLQRDDLGGDIHNDNPSEELNRFRQDQAGQSWGYPYCWSEYCLSQENGGSGIKGANTIWAWPSFIDAGYTDEWCRENTNESVMSMPAHSAPLGMTFYQWKDLSQDTSCEGGFPRSMDNYVFIAFHGSWNRSPPTGYKVVFVPMDSEGNPIHQPIDLFRHAGDGAKWPEPGIRPVDVQFDSCGRLYVNEDRTGSVIQIRYGGRYTDNFEPVEMDVADGASCIAPESTLTASSGAPSSSPSYLTTTTSFPTTSFTGFPTLGLKEVVQNLVNNEEQEEEPIRDLGDVPTSNSVQNVLGWWPVQTILLVLLQMR